MPDSAPPPSLKRRLVLALLAAFACGAVVGGTATGMASRLGFHPFATDCPPQPPERGPFRPPGPPTADMPLRLADKLCSELQLDESLRDPVRQIFRDGHAEAEPLRHQTDASFKAIFSKQNDKLRALLTPDQRERFNSLIAEWDRRHRPGPRH